MNPAHLLRYVISAALGHLAAREPRLDSPVARALMLGTAMVESNLTELQQREGPAIGLWQCERRTHDDVWSSWLAYRPDMHGSLRDLTVFEPDADEMRWNLLYACAVARLVYWRAREPLPGMEPGPLAEYWKRHYNTSLGRGRAEKARGGFERAIRYVAP